MARTPEANPEARESGNSNLDNLSKQAAEKKKASEQPDLIKVQNQTLSFAGKSWAYKWEWLRWWKDNVNKPYGNWTFIAGDGTVFEWKWNKNGEFYEGTLKANWRTYKIDKVNWPVGEVTSMGWTCYSSELWGTYWCTLDGNLKLSKISYGWVAISLEHSGSKAYLKSSKGRLELWSVDEDVAACRIAKCISIVKNSWYGLEYFEEDGDDVLQADYSGKYRDTDLLGNCRKMTWVSAYELVQWLNACRHSDFGI